MTPLPPFVKRLAWLSAIGAVLLTFGLRFSLLQRYGSDLPFHDQWDAEGLHLLQPWLGQADLTPFIFRFHNEHHPVLTKLISLGLVKADGMWSATPQLILNTFFQAAIVVMLWRLARRHLTDVLASLVAAAAAVTLSLPVLWENLLWGFQSQFYLAILLGLVHLDLVWSAPRLGWRWALGMAVGVLTLGTIAAGFLAVAASGFVALTQLRALRPQRLHAILTLGLALGISIAGVTWIHPVPYAAVARTPFAALEAFGILAGWPLGRGPVAVLVMLLPALLLLAGAWLRAERSAAQPWLLALVCWLGAATAAFAYGRAELIGGATPRYCDYLTVQCLVGTVCLLQFTLAQAGKVRAFAIGLTVLWVGIVGWGLQRAVREVAYYNDLPARAALQKAQEKLIGKFIRTDDTAIFTDSLESQLIHESQSHRLGLLRDVGLRGLLPTSVRPRYPVTAAGSSQGFKRRVDAEAEVSWSAPALRPTDATFRSEVLEPENFPILRFRVTGGLDGTTHQLVLVPENGGPVVKPLAYTTKSTVQSINFVTPKTPFRIEATALAGAPAFEFSAPVSLSRLNRLAGKSLGLHPVWTGLGIGLLALGLASALLSREGFTPATAGSAPARLQWSALAVSGLAVVALLGWPRPFTFGKARAEILYAPLTWDQTATGDFAFVSTSPHRNVDLDAIYPNVAPPGGFYGTFGLDGDRTVVEATSTPIALTGDFLAVPVAGYPNQTANTLELILQTGARRDVVRYKGAAPSERPQLWVVETGAHRGGTARIHIDDSAAGHQGWLGVGRPWIVTHPADPLRWKKLSDSNRLPDWRFAIALSGLMTAAAFAVVMRKKTIHPLASVRWP